MKIIRLLLVVLLMLLSGCSLFRKAQDAGIPPQIIGEILTQVSDAPKQIPCLDTLATAQYGNQLRHIPLNFGIRGFAKKEFGDFFPVAKKELERGRVWVGVNLLWSDSHQFGDKDIPFIKKEAARYKPLCDKFPGKMEISTFTEHNLSNPDKYHNIVQDIVGTGCKVINQVWNGALSKRYKNEIHGNHKGIPPPYNYSYDGTNSVDSDVVADLQTHSRAEVFCMWHPRLNLRYRDKDTANRVQRVKEAKQRSPDKNLLQSLIYLFGDKGNYQIPGNWLVKSHAEKHDANDKKGDKLLIISPIKGTAIELKRAGKLIAKLVYYGVFDGGGFRYYWQKFGYQAGANLDVFIGKKKYGIINGGFRSKPR